MSNPELVTVTVITVVVSSEWDVVSDELLIEVISDWSTSSLQQEVRNNRISKLHAMKCFFILISLKRYMMCKIKTRLC